MTRLANGRIKVVFFDLDGTLVDTAPDMVAVLQELQSDRGLQPLPYALGRSNVSNGALGLLRIAFPDEAIERQDPLMGEYLARYAATLCVKTTVFAGLGSLLERLDAARRPWGIVTNKPAHLTEPLLEQLALSRRVVCAISGDTLKQRKPDPAPLLYACEQAGVGPEEAVYIGDASRDIEAGRRAGMATIAAAYGYITAEDDVGRWGADAVATDTAELTQIVLKAVNLDT